MKKKLIGLFAGCALVTSYSWAAELVNTQDQMISKEVIIDQLIPKPKTRGIRINQSAQPGSAQAAEASVSMAINFEYNSAILTDQSKAQLSQLGEALQSPQLEGLSFLLEGHTDASGSNEYNMSLSQRRSHSAGQYLYQNYGVDPNRLDLVGRGETDLLDTANPNSATNRRVKITTRSN